MVKTRHGRSDVNDHIPDPERIKEILNVVSDQVPDLLRKLSDVIYGPDQAKKFGRAAAVFYKELKSSGMSEQAIFELTRDYLATLNVGNVFGKLAKEHEHEHEHEHIHKREHYKEQYEHDEDADNVYDPILEEELDEELKNHVRKRIKKRLEKE